MNYIIEPQEFNINMFKKFQGSNSNTIKAGYEQSNKIEDTKDEYYI